MAASNKEVVQQYWDALAARDWDAMKALLTDDAHYTDVGTPGPGGTGPEGVIARLRNGLRDHADHLRRGPAGCRAINFALWIARNLRGRLAIDS